ncbi:diaminopimelate epimerase [Eubacteriales bacterium OttesenSCG-928-G02]|nr:diaminopimelate epimerase [Eubacteriales bacterium OttesenSCG-928-G02]
MLKFTKMHGCGNDYIYFDNFIQVIENPNELSIKLSDRHFSIGGDGIVLICPSEVADCKMRMFNADGSEGKMCGNAIRCVGKFIYENGYAVKNQVTVETLSGIKKLDLTIINNQVVAASVDMGKAIFEPKKIPVNIEAERIINLPFNVNGTEYNINCISMGNPHCVVFMDNTDTLDIEKIGTMFEKNPVFPESVNTEFVEIINNNKIKMRVWERGSGETLACGTGACAAVVAACENGFCNKNEFVKVELIGGILEICYTDDKVIMNGPAEKVYEGTINI